MKKALALATAMVFLTSAWAVSSFAGRIRHRQYRQQKRIHQGVHSGQLTWRETRSLEREQRHIRQSRRRAWSDGRLTPRERARLEIQQDAASRHIYRAKHNDRTR